MQVMNFGAEVRTMTSREIAELTGKKHKHVLEDVRKMLEDLDLSSADFSVQYKDGRGRTQPCLLLTKEETLILVSGYSIPMRARIIDRWQELEETAPKPVELSRMDILKLAMESEEARIKAEAQLAIAAHGSAGLHRECVDRLQGFPANCVLQVLTELEIMAIYVNGSWLVKV